MILRCINRTGCLCHLNDFPHCVELYHFTFLRSHHAQSQIALAAHSRIGIGVDDV